MNCFSFKSSLSALLAAASAAASTMTSSSQAPSAPIPGSGASSRGSTPTLPAGKLHFLCGNIEQILNS